VKDLDVARVGGMTAEDEMADRRPAEDLRDEGVFQQVEDFIYLNYAVEISRLRVQFY